MNRILEFYKIIRMDKHEEPVHKKDLFYDTMVKEIIKINDGVKPTLTYKNILKLEQDLNNFIENTNLTLEAISLNGTSDEIRHFEGVKAIVKDKVLDTKHKIEQIKNRKTSFKIELNPEFPKSFKKVSQIEIFEQENKEILKNVVNERYKETRQRLLEIESLQDTIFEHLNIQDERIDDIIGKTGNIYNSVENNKKTLNSQNGVSSFLRRVFIILMFSLTFVLFFLHFYYK